LSRFLFYFSFVFVSVLFVLRAWPAFCSRDISPHFDYGKIMWAKKYGVRAIYRRFQTPEFIPVPLSPEE